MTTTPHTDTVLDQLRAADPVDVDALANRLAPGSDEMITTITDLHLVTGTKSGDTRPGTPRGTTGRRGRLLAVAAAVLVVAVTAATMSLWPGADRAAYAITVGDDGVIVVDWVADLRDGAELSAALRAHGVDVRVHTVPASPSQVGRVLVATVNGRETGPAPDGVSWGADGADDVFTWTIDPNRFHGSIDVEVGVRPPSGDPYVSAASAFAPGEVLGGLQCALTDAGEPVTAAAVDRQLTRLGVKVDWTVVHVAESATDGDIADNTPVTATPEGSVIDVYPVDAHHVEVEVAPPGADLSIPVYAPRFTTVPCPAGTATPWQGHL